MMDHLTRDRVRFRLTLTLSPPLLAMLQDPLLLKRCERRLESLLRLASREAKRTALHERELFEATLFAEQDLASLRELFISTYRRDLVGAFAKHRAAGNIEIITCGATHGFLPLMSHTPEAVRAQIQVATVDFKRIFGYYPEGIWLPECGYFDGVEKYLIEAGLRYSFLESHGITDAVPATSYGVMAPMMSTGGIAFFGRDMESSRQVWSAEVGYPGDPEYREFYKDAGYELPFKELEDFMKPDEPRRPVGLKRHRVTGKTGQAKEPYDRTRALSRVAEHAAHFARERRLQASRLRPNMNRPPLILSPYDAELFGHWWFEGPQFLEQVFRDLDTRNDVIATTPPAYLAKYDECEVATPPELSTWGAQGYAAVWLNETNDWIYPHYDVAVRRMVALANRFPSSSGLLERALNQAAREILLAQASDWAFIMKTGTMVEYANRRVTEHLRRFADLANAIEASQLDERAVKRYEKAWPIFPAMNYRVYCTDPLIRRSSLRDGG